jgi:hypothetical protein
LKRLVLLQVVSRGQPHAAMVLLIEPPPGAPAAPEACT